jgi:hypothetical protein
LSSSATESAGAIIGQNGGERHNVAFAPPTGTVYADLLAMPPPLVQESAVPDIELMYPLLDAASARTSFPGAIREGSGTVRPSTVGER